jgi:hypothetical protein
VPLQLPGDAVSVWPSRAAPEIFGAEVFFGLAELEAAPMPANSARTAASATASAIEIASR